MKTTIVGLAFAVLLLVPAGARAQLHIDIGVQFTGPPPLVLVSPEVQVVPEIEEEVFFVSGFYWVRQGEGWYRAKHCCRAWYPVRPHVVPAALVRIPPGHYRHYYRDDDGYWRPHRRDEYRAWRVRHSDAERHRWWMEHRYERRYRDEQRQSWERRRHDEPWHHQDYDHRRRGDDGGRGDHGRDDLGHGDHGGDDRGHGQDHGRGHDKH
jgi:hypothetical protein